MALQPGDDLLRHPWSGLHVDLQFQSRRRRIAEGWSNRAGSGGYIEVNGAEFCSKFGYDQDDHTSFVETSRLDKKIVMPRAGDKDGVGVCVSGAETDRYDVGCEEYDASPEDRCTLEENSNDLGFYATAQCCGCGGGNVGGNNYI